MFKFWPKMAAKLCAFWKDFVQKSVRISRRRMRQNTTQCCYNVLIAAGLQTQFCVRDIYAS